MVTAADRQINRTLRAFAVAREGARRFHSEQLGPEVDPSYCFADFLLQIARAASPKVAAGEKRKAQDRLERHYDNGRLKAAMDSSSGLTGGYLVPVDFREDLMFDIGEEAAIRPRAFVQPMGSIDMVLPVPNAQTVPAAAGISPFFGGINFRWGKGTGGAILETEPTFRDIELKSHFLSGYALASNTMLQDAGKGIEAWLRRLFGRGAAWAEDYAFLQGNGVGKPLGVLNSPATIAVARTLANDFTLNDSATMVSHLLPSSFNRACWLVSPTVAVKLLNLRDGTGASAWMADEAAPQLGEGIGRLHNRPVLITEKLPPLGTTGDVLLMDPGLYVIGDRQAIEIDVSFDEPTAYLKNQAVWRVIERVDGQPWLGNTIKLQDTSTTVSPYILLQ